MKELLFLFFYFNVIAFSFSNRSCSFCVMSLSWKKSEICSNSWMLRNEAFSANEVDTYKQFWSINSVGFNFQPKCLNLVQCLLVILLIFLKLNLQKLIQCLGCYVMKQLLQYCYMTKASWSSIFVTIEFYF